MKWKTEPRELIYTYVSGKGAPKYGKKYTSEDPTDFDFKASTIYTAEEAKPIQKLIADFWKANKVAGKKYASSFLKEEEVVTEEKDEMGEPIKKKTGNFILTASTNCAFRNKKGEVSLNSVSLLTSKGVKIPTTHPLATAEVGVGDKSRGIIHGDIAVTTYESNAYVKLYLKGVQFTHFVPRELAGVEAEDVSEGEDDGLGGDGLDVVDASSTEGPNL